jgi:hypothetical protein
LEGTEKGEEDSVFPLKALFLIEEFAVERSKSATVINDCRAR